MVRPSAGARIVSALVLHASAQPSISAGAQPAAVADAAARPQDRGVFERQIDTIVIPFYRCGAAKRQPVGPLHHSRTHQLDLLCIGRSLDIQDFHLYCMFNLLLLCVVQMSRLEPSEG